MKRFTPRNAARLAMITMRISATAASRDMLSGGAHARRRRRATARDASRRARSSFITESASHGAGGATGSSARWNAARRLTSSTGGLHPAPELLDASREAALGGVHSRLGDDGDLVHGQVEPVVEVEDEPLALLDRAQRPAELDALDDGVVLGT